MRIQVFSILQILFLSNVCLSKSEKIGKVQRTEGGEIEEGHIKYNLISDEISGPNRFQISYEVTYGEFIFKRFEKCYVVESINNQEGSGELSCSGKTKFSRTGNVKNVTNYDDYTYSSNGFNHSGETFKVSGDYYRVNEIDLLYGLQAEPISANLNFTQTVKKLQFERIGMDNLTVNFTIDSTFFAMNRTENFSVGIDDETGTDDLICEGRVNVIVRNSDIYHTVQKEDFLLDEDYSFAYVSEAKLLNNNNKNNTNNY